MAQVSESMRSFGHRRSDQGRVWEDISEKSARFHVFSDTSAMSDIYAQEGERIKDYLNSFSVLEGQCGAVFAIDGKVIGLDLFDSADTLKKLFPKLLRSYALDALDKALSTTADAQAPSASAEAALSFLERIGGMEASESRAIGEGQDIRLSGSGLTGAALVAGERIVHLSTFVS